MKKGKKIWNRLLSLVLCLVMVTGVFAGMGMEAEAATASGVQIVNNGFASDEDNGLVINVSHNKNDKTVTVTIDATNYQRYAGEYEYMEYTPEITIDGVGENPGWKDPEYNEGFGTKLVSTLTYTYTDATNLYGIYKIEFLNFALLYVPEGYNGALWNDTLLGTASISLLFPMTDDQKNNVSFSAQMRRVLDDGSPEESGHLGNT